MGDEPYRYIDQILSCQAIASSSLHGLIAADAYGIPSVWIELSDKVHGNGFKFRDYFLSVGRPDRPPLQVNDATRPEEVRDRVEAAAIRCDLNALWDACPFRKTNGDAA